MSSEETIYVLKLTDDKYYVGKTTDLDWRLHQHEISQGSAWTSTHAAIECIDSFPGDGFSEDAEVKRLMSKHGIDNVRGGNYSQIELTDDTKKHISQLIYGSTDRCFNCGSSDHFVKHCPNKRTTCCGKTKSGERCKRPFYLDANGYCKDHKYQHVPKSTSSPARLTNPARAEKKRKIDQTTFRASGPRSGERNPLGPGQTYRRHINSRGEVQFIVFTNGEPPEWFTQSTSAERKGKANQRT